DSRTILDQGGAEKLLGAGDMLYLSGDMGKPVRLQSAFISESEVKKVVDFIAKHNEPELPIDIGGSSGSGGESSGSMVSGGFSEDDNEVDDSMVEEARRVVIESGKASTSFLQRKLSLGYSRAARIMDILESKGVVGPQNGSKPREIFQKPTEVASQNNDGV
ncbi:MAG: DNA segregation ATPase FtsK/SpoIIIE, partial [Parcubacteria group bacterium Gr01-1014_56]